MNKKSFLITAVMVLVFSLVVVTAAEGATIIVKADGTGDYPTIQAAIDDANDGDEVVLESGTYTGDGNWDIDFLGKAITVRSASPNDPNVVALTIIDGDGQYHNGFYFHSNEEPNSMLLGLSIKGFTGNGIEVSNARPVIRKCRIYDNENGIYASFSLSSKIDTLISDCIITQNKGVGIGVGDADVKIYNCIIENNEHSGVVSFGDCGGAIGDLILENCSISQNGYIGLDFRSELDSVSLNKCSIIGNRGNNGGGICSSCDLTVENSVLAGNYSSYDGGAIVFYEPLTLRNCTIVGNYTERNYVITCNSWRSANIENCIIWSNYPNSIRFRGNYNNYVSYCDIEGGINSIVLDEGAILNWGQGNIETDPCFTDLGFWGVNNIPGDPGNGYWVNGDYYLLPNSLCIDAGDPNYVSQPNDLDPDGHPRVVDGNCDDASLIDMGAYEFSWAYLGDFDGQCDVDLLDFAILGDAWFTDPNMANWDPACDISEPNDNFIDTLDLDVFTDNYLTAF